MSNLNFISKILEKIVVKRINVHLSRHHLANPQQSAYKQHHSTETALLNIKNDFLRNMDRRKVTALVLLDLSAAFDTIDHSILIDRLSTWFGICGKPLSWFKSYLHGRSQSINLSGTLSSSFDLPYGVPQGSVLGPLLFTLYTTPLSKIIDSHSVSHHLYSDDTQIYTSFDFENSKHSLTVLQNCLSHVQSWMHLNKLKLNAEKTEFILLGHKQQRDKFEDLFPIKLLNIDTMPSDSVKNLGVIFDSNMTFGKNMTQLCKISFYHIRNLKRIRKYLSLTAAKSIANALVCGRLDYCNSLLTGVTSSDLDRLQRVQNCLARVVTRSPRFSPSFPLLKSLHWLPIKARIQFKLGTITYKALTENQPPYLRTHLTISNTGRGLRSDSRRCLVVPKIKSKTGSSAFSACAPTYWNSLPCATRCSNSLASFRKSQKTYLFKISYPP